MSIFLSDKEKELLRKPNSNRKLSNLYWGLLNRVKKYSYNPGLSSAAGTNSEWWHHAAEYVTDAALVCALNPADKSLDIWLRHAVLEIARRPEADWIGPFFRDHTANPPSGHLETTHLSIAVAVALDLVPGIFTDDEKADLEAALRDKAIPLCREWIKNNRHLANWRCILLAGMAVPAAVLNDREVIAEAAAEYDFCLNVVQPDGTYAESLQYSNYCYYGLMMTHEALMRRAPSLKLSNRSYAKAVQWFVQSYLYNKPMTGWGAYPMPRSLNFNDSAAIFGADPDLLMHISATLKDEMPLEAGLAKWMFDELYTEFPAQGPFDRNTFGFVNRYGFLSVIHYASAADAVSPECLPPAVAFSNGDCVARSSWSDSKTVLGFSASSSDGMYAPGHLHGDINSIILVHNNERLLVDPGHTCYRSLIHEFDCATKAHNTCTFQFSAPDNGLQENAMKTVSIQQHTCPTRTITGKHQVAPPVPRGGKMLLSARIDDVSVFANDAAELYGKPIEKFERCVILAGENAVFVIDRIDAGQDVITSWNWLLNNRDGELDFKVIYPDRLVARRGNSGMKLFSVSGDSTLCGPAYGYVHDAYHPLPQQPGEGAPGSGMLFNWKEKKALKSRVAVHAVAVDEYGILSGWHFKRGEEDSYILEGPGACCSWELNIEQNSFMLSETVSGRKYIINAPSNNAWSLEK
ncbi:MAG: heparinase II/III family protein [Victivallales bacterium]|nr:heparinase II/III family protein [Victivallales bacterium]